MRIGPRLVTAGVAALLLWGGMAPPTAAQDSGAVSHEYADALAEEAKVRADYDAAVAKQFQLAGEMQTLDASIAFVQTELAAAQTRFDEASVQASAAAVQLAETEADLADQQRRLRDQSVAAYIGGGSGPMPNFSAALKDEAGFDALAKSQVYAAAVVTDRKALVDKLVELRETADRLRKETARHEADARSARDEVAARVSELEQQREQRALAQLGAAQAASDAQLLFGELETKRRGYELRYAELATQSDSIREVLAVRQKGQFPALTTFGIFLNPVKNGKVVSGYGMRMHPILEVDKLHAGLDIHGDMGAPMRASADGTVVIADERGGYGNTVVVEHGNQLATVYAHMSGFAVRVGDVVTRGQVVGQVGSTGLSTGPHCHWEVRVIGVPVDGTPYLSTTPE